jgi:hypothetical protein
MAVQVEGEPTDDGLGCATVCDYDELDEHTQDHFREWIEKSRVTVDRTEVREYDVVKFTDYYRIRTWPGE